MKFKTKVVLFLLITGFSAGSLIIFLTSEVVRSSEMADLIDIGLDKAIDLADKSPHAFETQSETLLLPLLQEGQVYGIDADYVAALDTQGRVLAHTDVTAKGMVYSDPLTLEILRQDKPGTRVIQEGKKARLEVWAPVWARQNDDSNEQFLLGGAKSFSFITSPGDHPIRPSA